MRNESIRVFLDRVLFSSPIRGNFIKNRYL